LLGNGNGNISIPLSRRIRPSAARLIIRIQMLEIEDGAILGLAIGTIELGGVIVADFRLSQHRRRLVEVEVMTMTIMMMMIIVIVIVMIMGIGCNYSDGNAFRLCTMIVALWRQHFVAVSRLQQRQIC